MVRSILAASALVAVVNAGAIQKRVTGLPDSHNEGWKYNDCAEIETISPAAFFDRDTESWPTGFSPYACQTKCDSHNVAAVTGE